ncbi:hypothetical protein PG991_014264 [Apiospora marii]|uniref:Rhodopsin domain-containing protein n=1 Tax=Apiospora marii TaxID=335849 RepID=A0ABR1R940_9PEZI
MSDTSKDGLLALCFSMMILPIIAIGLRFSARKQQRVPLMADDWTATVALVSHIGATICMLKMVHHQGLSHASLDLTPEQIAAGDETERVLRILVGVLIRCTLAFVKLSAVFFYRRIFCSSGRLGIFNILTWSTIVLVALWLLVFEFLLVFQCGSGSWRHKMGSFSQTCTLVLPSVVGFSISDFILDIWILALPIRGILRLHTTLQRKLSIVGIFLLASVGLGASTVRMVISIRIQLGDVAFLFNTDPENRLSQMAFYAMLECGMALIAINLPSLRVLVGSPNMTKLAEMARSMLQLSFLCDNHSDSGPNHSSVRNNDDAKSFQSSRIDPAEGTEVPSNDYLQVRLSFLEDLEGQRWSFTEVQTTKPRKGQHEGLQQSEPAQSSLRGRAP